MTIFNMMKLIIIIYFVFAGPCKNAAVLELITDLTALMLQIKNLADNDHNAYELQVLEGNKN